VTNLERVVFWATLGILALSSLGLLLIVGRLAFFVVTRT